MVAANVAAMKDGAGPEAAVSARNVEIEEMAENCLRSNAYLALKNITCEFSNGILTLRGCLPSYYLKQVAQAAVAQLKGVTRVENQIQVVGPTGRIGG